jgi:pantoate--beta-alanine ligase
MLAPVATIEAVRRIVIPARRAGRTIGLVPTMGALHAGHASLLRAARVETSFVVASIFINPTQFGPNEDLDRYPRALAQDLDLCGQEGVDLVFVPQAAEMYPSGFRTFVAVEQLQDVLCGGSRPGHFRGVATVVLKLFHIVQPDLAYFGQKDAQQVRVIRQLVRDLNVPIQVRVCPIVREPDGLALSSRNRYLSAADREHATVLYRALQEVQSLIQQGEHAADRLRRVLTDRIAATPGALLDYATVVDADTLEPVSRLQGEILVALAVRFGGTRLIDNLVLRV